MGATLGSVAVLQPNRGAGMIERHGPRRDIGSDEPAPTITAGCKGSGPRFSVMSAYLLEPAPTVCATENKGHTNPDRDRGRSTPVNRASGAWYLATGKRRLTVQECAILQGFPADYPWTGTLEAQYRQVGNAVCPPVAEALVRAALS